MQSCDARRAVPGQMGRVGLFGRARKASASSGAGRAAEPRMLAILGVRHGRQPPATPARASRCQPQGAQRRTTTCRGRAAGRRTCCWRHDHHTAARRCCSTRRCCEASGAAGRHAAATAWRAAEGSGSMGVRRQARSAGGRRRAACGKAGSEPSERSDLSHSSGRACTEAPCFGVAAFPAFLFCAVFFFSWGGSSEWY